MLKNSLTTEYGSLLCTIINCLFRKPLVVWLELHASICFQCWSARQPKRIKYLFEVKGNLCNICTCKSFDVKKDVILYSLSFSNPIHFGDPILHFKLLIHSYRITTSTVDFWLQFLCTHTHKLLFINPIKHPKAII